MSIPEITNEWIDEHNAKLATCKIEGCDNPVEKKLGPYGGLCQGHRQEQQMAKNGQAEKPARKREPTLAEFATQIEQADDHLGDLVRKMRARLDAL